MDQDLALIPTVIHKHRIIPGHMGGTYVNTNVIHLTIAAHAEAHLELYKRFGLWKDLTAYLGLLKLTERAYLIKQVNRMAHLGKKANPELRAKLSNLRKGNTHAKALRGRKQSSEHIAKRVASRKQNNNYFPTVETRLKLRMSHLGKPSGRKGTGKKHA